MTTTLQRQPRAIEALEIVDRLIHEIQNNLQVIRMEAELSAMEDITARRFQCAFDATQNIERLLGEMREWFLLPR